jgi:dTDP-4-dehydrorhamnose reductase
VSQGFPPECEVGAGDWIVNAAGLIRHRIDTNDYVSCWDAIKANALLPYLLTEEAVVQGAKLLQIATDCVFSGSNQSGRDCYFEGDPHDAPGIYSQSKSLGEVKDPVVCNLRCSVVGPEQKGFLGLLEWFLGQPEGARIKGYVNHLWNGLTTLAFAKLVEGIVAHGLLPPANLLHVVPGGRFVSKYELLCMFKEHFGREDVTIEQSIANPVRLVLATKHEKQVDELWKLGGYEKRPTIEEMIVELAAFDCRFRDMRERRT